MHTHFAKIGFHTRKPKGPRDGLQKHSPKTVGLPDLTAPSPEMLISWQEVQIKGIEVPKKT